MLVVVRFLLFYHFVRNPFFRINNFRVFDGARGGCGVRWELICFIYNFHLYCLPEQSARSLEKFSTGSALFLNLIFKIQFSTAAVVRISKWECIIHWIEDLSIRDKSNNKNCLECVSL